MKEQLSLTVSSSCLLTGVFPALEKAIKERLSIDNPKYISAKKFGKWIGKDLKKKLEFFESTPEGLRFPRGFANQAMLLCNEFHEQIPTIQDNRLLLPKEKFKFQGVLRPYQTAAVLASRKRAFGVIEAGTGSGKTVMALAIIANRKQPTLIIVHTKELLYQWQKRIMEFLGEESGLVGDGHFNIRTITVAIVNTARGRIKDLAQNFGHLVVDECHRVPASLFTDVVNNFPGHYLLGLSATAFRNDEGTTKLIYFYMGDLIHRVDPNELKKIGAIVKPELRIRKTCFKYDYQGDYQPLIEALTKDEDRNKQIVFDVIREARTKGAGIQLLVSDRVEHCQVFTEQLFQYRVKAVQLTGKTSAKQRSKIIEQVQNEEIQVLVSTLQLIGEGFDCPRLTNLFLTTPISFEGRLLQILGRIMRPSKGKHAIVYDYVDELVPVLNRSAKTREKFY